VEQWRRPTYFCDVLILDLSSPFVDATLPDSSRLRVVSPDITIPGSCLLRSGDAMPSEQERRLTWLDVVRLRSPTPDGLQAA